MKHIKFILIGSVPVGLIALIVFGLTKVSPQILLGGALFFGVILCCWWYGDLIFEVLDKRGARKLRQETFVLSMLKDRDMYGLDLIKNSDGLLTRGTIYFTLQQMEEKKLIESYEGAKDPESGVMRRVYTVVN